MTDANPVLDRLRDLCGQIAQGKYEAIDGLFEMTADSDVPSEFQELAEAFGSMIVQVEAREFRLSNILEELRESNRQLEEAEKRLRNENFNLRKQVKKLRIEIDQSQKDTEVSEIVETDYFRELQQRARALRRRQKGDRGHGE